MRLLRLATLELNRPAPPRLGRWTFRASNGVEVTTEVIQGADDITASGIPPAVGEMTVAWPYERTSARLALIATVDAGTPDFDNDRLIVIPEAPRKLAEAAIVEYGDLLSVTYQCRRIVRSPKPCIGLAGDNESEQSTLSESGGIRAPLLSRPRAVLLPEAAPDSPFGQAVADRLDGLALLADANSEEGPVGQVQNMFRLFERAFARGPKGCVEPLLAFLTAGSVDLGWSREELADWFQRLRPEVTHADRREEYARGADVAPYLGRIEYAAYDVLLNKSTWRSVDSGRRDVVALGAGLDHDRETMRLQRPGVTVVVPWIDPFGIFPIDFSFIPQASSSMLLTKMPGYTGDNDAYIARFKAIHDYLPEAQTYEFEVLTYHGRVTPSRCDVMRPSLRPNGRMASGGQRVRKRSIDAWSLAKPTLTDLLRIGSLSERPKGCAAWIGPARRVRRFGIKPRPDLPTHSRNIVAKRQPQVPEWTTRFRTEAG